MFVHELVAEQARLRPASVAVTRGERRLTYGELAWRANGLAHRLRAAGVGPEVLVGICLDRSPELLVAELAVLGAGGAYVPMDPAYPAERLAFMAEDAAAPVLLTTRALRSALPRHAGTTLLVDDDAAGADEGPAAGVRPANLAYGIYTSGSTGRPKGVMIEHRNLANLVVWHVADFGLTAADRASLLSTPSFDASVWETWPPLATGASLHVPADEVRTSPEGLRTWLLELGITCCFLPTPLCEAMLQHEWPTRSPLRLVLTGGDELRRAPAGTPFALVNNYGPTETTVVATSIELGKSVGGAGERPSIGRAVAGVRVSMLDEQLRPVPAGEPGELWIAGAGVARGYLGRADLTADRFRPEPDGPAAGGRTYRSGDRVAELPGGELRFLGRMDRQIKLRGIRIEPGEIEGALLDHPGLAMGAVVVDGRDAGRLVACCVPRPGRRPTRRELRSFLERRLPEHLVPAEFVLLDALPLLPSGKLDHAALAAAAAGGGRPAPPARPPTEREVLVAGSWAELLGRSDLGPDDDFFDLGGHSLLAAQLVTRLRRATDSELSVGDVLEARTVAGLGRMLDLEAATALPE